MSVTVSIKNSGYRILSVGNSNVGTQTHTAAARPHTPLVANCFFGLNVHVATQRVHYWPPSHLPKFVISKDRISFN